MGGDRHDEDFLGARLHARRARICEVQRLEALCGLRSLPALAAELGLDEGLTTARAFERHLLRELVAESRSLVAESQSPAARLVRWMLARLQLELLKVVLRGQGARADRALVREQLFELPAGPDPDALLAASSPEETVDLLGDEALQRVVEQALTRHGPDALLLFESALTQGYYQELLARARRVEGGEGGWLVELMAQEADTFHLMLVARGRFHEGVPAEALRRLHVEGTALSRTRYRDMLASPDLAAAARHALERVIDRMPRLDDASRLAARLERQCWARYLRLARRVFRRSEMGPGLLIAYVALRRIEVANLVTIAEGLRLAVPAELLRARLLPGAGEEEARAA